MTVKRNPFAKKSENSFLNLVGMITESDEMDEMEGLDFDDEAEGDDLGEDDFADDDMGDDEFDTEEDGDTVTLSIPRSLAMELMDALQAVIDSEEGDDEFGGEEGDDEFGDDEFGDDEYGDDEFGGEFGDEDEEEQEEGAEEAEEEQEEEQEEGAEEAEEDEEVLGSDQSNVAQSTISRNGAPKRSKATTTWNTGKTVKSVFDQTVSHEGEPAGVSRDGAPKRSKFSKSWNNSKTVSSRLQPKKHIFEIGK
jgi:hypothetical protein